MCLHSFAGVTGANTYSHQIRHQWVKGTVTNGEPMSLLESLTGAWGERLLTGTGESDSCITKIRSPTLAWVPKQQRGTLFHFPWKREPTGIALHSKVNPPQLRALAPTAEAGPLFLSNLLLFLLTPSGRKLCCVAFPGGDSRRHLFTSNRTLVAKQRNDYTKSLTW